MDEPRVTAIVGGPVEESSVAVCLYGDDLDPDSISARLGCACSHSFRRGDLQPRTLRSREFGAWFLKERGTAPLGPAELLASLLDRLPEDPKLWSELRREFDVRLRVAVHFDGWNREFDLPGALVAKIAQLGVQIRFDLYAYVDDEADAALNSEERAK
ncbi:MAG: DUF4279 domain-containing protein [Polyangiales bacterium]